MSMTYPEVAVKKLRAICDLLEAGPSGPTKLERHLAARVVTGIGKALDLTSSELASIGIKEKADGA